MCGILIICGFLMLYGLITFPWWYNVLLILSAFVFIYLQDNYWKKKKKNDRRKYYEFL
jgi:threonine/homoserine/homoserine lactone efflux protein